MLILAAAVAVYFETFDYPFAFDDLHTVQENVKIRNLDSFYSVAVFRAPRPLVDFSFALNYHFGKLRVLGYHLVNLFIHVLNGILVFFLSARIFQKLCFERSNIKFPSSPSPSGGGPGWGPINQSSQIYFMALFSALVFVVHPIQTQAVTYTAQRYTSMAAFFYLLSVLCYMIGRDDGVDRHSVRRYLNFVLSAVFGLMAFFCKQNAASLPMAILLMEYVCYDQSRDGWKRKLLWIVPFIGVFGLAYTYNLGLFTRNVQVGWLLEDVFEAARETRDITRWQYLCTQFNVISIYIRLLFLPVDQNLDYLYPIKNGFFDGATPYFFIFLVGILVLSSRCRKKHPEIFVGVMWFFITISVESSIFPIRDALFEHRLYLPMFGFAIIVSYVMFAVLSAYHFWAYGVTAAIVVVLSVATYQRNEIWKDCVSLWTDVIKKNPSNHRGNTNLALALEQSGKLDEALKYYNRAIQIKPDSYYALSNKGAMLGRVGKTDEAIKVLQDALALKPNYSLALNNMGVTLAVQNKETEAIQYFQQAIRYRPDYLDAKKNLAMAFEASRQYDKAERQFNEALSIDPENTDVHRRLGVLLHNLQRYDDAIAQFKEAIRFDSENADLYLSLGNAQMADNLFAEAIASFEKVVRINPRSIEAYSNMGVAFMRLGDNDQAEKSFLETLKINPESVEALSNLGAVHYSQGRFHESLQKLGAAIKLRPSSKELRENIAMVIQQLQRVRNADKGLEH